MAELDTAIGLLAAPLHREHKLATADAIVYATARYHGAELLACDAHFDGHHGAELLACDAHFDGLPQVICASKAVRH